MARMQEQPSPLPRLGLDERLHFDPAITPTPEIASEACLARRDCRRGIS